MVWNSSIMQRAPSGAFWCRMSDSHTVIRAATQAFYDANEIVRIIDLLRVGNDPAIIEEINRRHAAPTAKTIQLSLFTRLHMVVCRHYGPVRKGDYSARAAFELLDKPEVLKSILEIGVDEPLLKDARIIWPVWSRDPNLRAYMHLRNKFVAHLSDEDPSVKVPLIKEIFSIGGTSARLFDQLARAIHCTTTNFEFERKQQHKSALAFWSIWKTV